ncbi:MAG: hypothetical protein DHS20C19_20820 [Acidimicrobiales bacterium]|nr:MAG: hypothetical protein DHS20C19_20820 [Acidimicrobiales bacterium]
MTARTTAGWQVVAVQELRDLWRSTKGLSVLFGFTVLLSAMAYAAASEADLNLLDSRESVGLVGQAAIALGALAALVVSADAISGERERGTLESILVTPLSRRDLVIGKLVAASTMWLAAVAVAVPYLATMGRGPGISLDAVLTVCLAGSLAAAALTALGLAISAVSYSNRASLAASVALLILLAAPSQLPAITTRSTLGSILIKANPVAAGMRLTDQVLVKQHSWSSQWTLLLAPAIAAVVLTGLAVRMSRRLELGDSR